MDVERVGLQEFIRYVLGAGIAALVLALEYPQWVASRWCALSGAQAGLVSLGLLLFGSAVYAIHRAVLHPIVLRLIVLGSIALFRRSTDHRGFLNPFAPMQLELRLIEKRWFGSTPERAERWASQVHSLYCSSWAVAAAWAIAPIYLGRPTHAGWFPWIFCLLLGSAILEDIRLSYSVIVKEIERAGSP